MAKDPSWTPLHNAAWQGRINEVHDLILTESGISSEGQSPLYLAIARWGKRPEYQEMLRSLWSADASPQSARWGDTAWGGGLTLLDLSVDKDLPEQIAYCKIRGIHPNDRTWAIALNHENDRPLALLGCYFEPPQHLPEGAVRVRAMHSAREAMLLDEKTTSTDGKTEVRRL